MEASWFPTFFISRGGRPLADWWAGLFQESFVESRPRAHSSSLPVKFQAALAESLFRENSRNSFVFFSRTLPDIATALTSFWPGSFGHRLRLWLQTVVPYLPLWRPASWHWGLTSNLCCCCEHIFWSGPAGLTEPQLLLLHLFEWIAGCKLLLEVHSWTWNHLWILCLDLLTVFLNGHSICSASDSGLELSSLWWSVLCGHDWSMARYITRQITDVLVSQLHGTSSTQKSLESATKLWCY